MAATHKLRSSQAAHVHAGEILQNHVDPEGESVRKAPCNGMMQLSISQIFLGEHDGGGVLVIVQVIHIACAI